MGKVLLMAGAAHENLLAPMVVDDAWVDNRSPSSPVDPKSRGCWYDDRNNNNNNNNWALGRITGSQETPERPHICSNSYQWLCKRGTNAVSFQNTFTAG